MNLLYQQETESQLTYYLFTHIYCINPLKNEFMIQFFRDFVISWWVFLIETDRKHYKGYKILIQYTFAYIVNRIQYTYL